MDSGKLAGKDAVRNVLVVDDDNIFNLVSSKLLQQTGIFNEIHTAMNGEEAMNLINDYYRGMSSLPDVILLDLNMPVMDGFGFMAAFQKLATPRKSDVKIIIVSSSNHPEDIKTAKKFGAAGYIVKPLTEHSLMEALKELNAT